MATEATTQDSAAPATTEDAALVDTASTDTATTDTATPAVTEEDAVLAAIRGEDAPKVEGDEPTGEAKPTEPVAKAGETNKPAEGTEPKGGKEPEALDQETPKDYKGRTRENFERIRAEGIGHRTKALELEAQLTALAPNIEREANFTKLLADSEGTPEDIGTAISLIRAVNKGTLEERRNALQVVNALRGIIADQIGEALPDVDYLAGHADLVQRVKDGDLSADDAKEMALGRRRTKAATDTAEQIAERQRKADAERQATDTEATARQSAAKSVESAAAAYLQRDGQAAYQVRVTYAQQAFQQISKHSKVDPAAIPALFAELYESKEAQMLVDATKARPATVAGVKPVMGVHRSGSGTAVPEAQTEEQAVLMALRGG